MHDGGNPLQVGRRHAGFPIRIQHLTGVLVRHVVRDVTSAT
jgi:hypothetical protein